MHINFNSGQRIAYSKLVICLSWLSIVLLSSRLWLNERNFPRAPLFDFFPVLPAPFDYVQPVLFVLLLILIAVIRKSSFLIIVMFVFFFLLAAGDQNRLQPYSYMYAFMLLFIGSTKNQDDPALEEEPVLNGLRIMLIGTYLWAGIHKLNIHFIDHLYPFIARSAFNMLPGFEPDDPLWKYIILLLPLTEIFIALGLTLNRTRRLALHLVVFMHLAIMIFLSPFGFSWNLVVIPWNGAMILLNILLFWKVDDIQPGKLWHPKKSLLKAIVILLFIIMPVFNFFGLWDHYLSSSLYSFKTPYGKIYVDETLKGNLPSYLNQYCYKDAKGEFIELTYWMIGEINVLPYPEPRVYSKVKEFVCTYDTRDTCHAVLEIYY